MSDLLERWESAKKDFEKITGKKKPDPKGFFAKQFNHSGLTDSLEKADEKLDAIGKESKADKRAKLVAEGVKHVATLRKTTKKYLDVLGDAAKDEIAENNAKTEYSKGLKALRSELNAIEKIYEQKIDGWAAVADTSVSRADQAVLMIAKALDSAVAQAQASIKKIKADPTAERWAEYWTGNADTPARKIQVQLVAAANAQKKGKIPELMIDPRHVADKLTPWQAQNKNMTVEPKDKKEMLARLKEFSGLVKLSERFHTDLVEKTGG